MNLMNILLDNQNSAAVGQIAKNFGLSESAARDAIADMAPALMRGMQRNTASPEGLEQLTGALSKGNHQRYVDQPETLAEESTLADGNAILGHLFGSKDVSREVASHAAGSTGLDEGLLKKMLPVVASLVMGSMSKQATAGGTSSADGSDGGLLGQLLDRDGDGSVMDDIMGMAGRFLR
jgi:hypothetical protein